MTDIAGNRDSSDAHRERWIRFAFDAKDLEPDERWLIAVMGDRVDASGHVIASVSEVACWSGLGMKGLNRVLMSLGGEGVLRTAIPFRLKGGFRRRDPLYRWVLDTSPPSAERVSTTSFSEGV